MTAENALQIREAEVVIPRKSWNTACDVCVVSPHSCGIFIGFTV